MPGCSDTLLRSVQTTAMVCALACLPSTASADDEAPIISNFKFGLICGPNDNRRVCFKTDVVQVTNESRCIYNQQPMHCTWFGFSFDYEAKVDVIVKCLSSDDVVSAYGNPKEAFAPAKEFTFDLSLKQGKHHFFLAQYITGEKTKASLKNSKETCSFNGTELFSQAFEYEFAEPEEPQESVPDLSGLK